MDDTYDFNSLLSMDRHNNKKKPFDSKAFVSEWCKDKSSHNDIIYECVCNSDKMNADRFNNYRPETLGIKHQQIGKLYSPSFLRERMDYICNKRSSTLNNEKVEKCRQYFTPTSKETPNVPKVDIQRQIDALNPKFNGVHYLSYNRTSHTFFVPKVLPLSNDTVTSLRNIHSFFRNLKGLNLRDRTVASIFDALKKGTQYYEDQLKKEKHKEKLKFAFGFGCNCRCNR